MLKNEENTYNLKHSVKFHDQPRGLSKSCKTTYHKVKNSQSSCSKQKNSQTWCPKQQRKMWLLLITFLQ